MSFMAKARLSFLLRGCSLAALVVVVSPAVAQTKKPLASTLPSPLAQELARLKGAGIPLEAPAVPPPPVGLNAAPVYVRIAQQLTTAEGRETIGKLALLAIRSVPTADQVSAAKEALAANAAIPALLLEAATKPECVFTAEIEPAMVQRSLASLRDAARWVAAGAYVLQAEGKPAEAVAHLATGAALGRHARQATGMRAWTIGAVCDIILLASLERVLTMHGSKPEVVRAASEAASGWLARDVTLPAALRREAPALIKAIDEMRDNGLSEQGNGQAAQGVSAMVPASLRGVSPKSPPWRRYADEVGAALLSMLRRTVDLSEGAYPALRQSFDTFNEQLEAGGKPSLVLAAAIVPQFALAAEYDAQARSRAACIRAACAALSARSAQGAFPSSLDAAAFPDPYSGAQVGYRREGEGFVVWSPGPAGRFNGGGSGTAPTPRDVLLRYPLAPGPVQAR